MCTFVRVCVLASVRLVGLYGGSRYWEVLLNCPELPPECQGARQVLSTNFWLVAVPVAPDKGLGK